jgi:hypothetical protein
MSDELIYLDTYLLQQDMRVRMPKCILENMNVEKGKTRFSIYYNKLDNSLVLKNSEESTDKEQK